MKAILLAAVVMASSAWAINGGQEYNYSGRGQWKDTRGRSGTYKVSVTLSLGKYAATYVDGRDTKTISADVVNHPTNGTFEIRSNGVKIGSGYCMSVQCHTIVTVNGVTIEETSTFYNNSLYKLGSKTVNGEQIMWEEEMVKQP